MLGVRRSVCRFNGEPVGELTIDVDVAGHAVFLLTCFGPPLDFFVGDLRKIEDEYGTYRLIADGEEIGTLHTSGVLDTQPSGALPEILCRVM